MKTLYALPNKKRASILMLCFLLMICFMFSCNEQSQDPVQSLEEEFDQIPEEELSDAAARIGHCKKKYDGGPITLCGVQNYFTYALKERALLQDQDNPCDVTLEFLDNNEVALSIIEHLEDENGNPIQRPSQLYGKMNKHGMLKLSYPVPLIPNTDIAITDILRGHTGCELFGPGINQRTLIFRGYFNGRVLKASAYFMSKCDVQWEPNDIFETPVDGTVKWRWSFDLFVGDQCNIIP